MKQQDMQRDKEIASMTKKKNSIKDVKDEIERTKEKIHGIETIIQFLIVHSLYPPISYKYFYNL